MKTSLALLMAGAAALASAANSSFPAFSGDPFQKYTLEAKGIKASWIPYGARLTNMWVPDRNGKMQDIVVGYDDGRGYLTQRNYFGAVVGRYANRIKNGTFSIGDKTYHTPLDENGHDTLHGGDIGYDMRNWTIAKQTSDSITFVFYDQAKQGFPGDVLNIATYTLTDEPAFHSRLTSLALDDTTPIMLANHIYWNPGAFINKEALKILETPLTMPYSKRWINIDGWEVPTGNISLTAGGPLDFTKTKTIGKDIMKTKNGCGTGCTGYDNAFILDRPRYSYQADPGLPVLEWSSPETGIKMTLHTNQDGLQLYTCDTQDGTIKAKKDQQHINGNTTYEQYGCMVIETQDVSFQHSPSSSYRSRRRPTPVQPSVDAQWHAWLTRYRIVDRWHQPARVGSQPVPAVQLQDRALPEHAEVRLHHCLGVRGRGGRRSEMMKAGTRNDEIFPLNDNLGSHCKSMYGASSLNW